MKKCDLVYLQMFFDSESHRFLSASIPGYYDYMMNQATQNIRNYGTKWSDQKPVSTYSMSDESNLFDPDVIDPSVSETSCPIPLNKPEFIVAAYRLSPTFSRPAGLENVVTAI